MSCLSEILNHSPVNTEFKVCAENIKVLDKAWQCCERFESHSIKIRQGDVQSEWLVRIIPHHVDIDEDEYNGDVLQVAFSLAGLCAIGYITIGWLLS